MDILFTRFPLESAYGGAEVQTITLMEGLLKRGHHLQFLGSCPVLHTLCEQRDISATHLDIGPPPVTKWGATAFLWRQRTQRRQLAMALDAFPRVSAICMLSLTEKLLLTPLACKRGMRVLWVEHDRVGRWLRWNPWLSRLQRLSHDVMTVCVSELSRQQYTKLGWPEKKVIAIPNGVEVPAHSTPEKTGDRVQMTDEVLHIGCVARLSHDKGVDVLIDAVTQLPDAELTIVGRGREAEALRERARRAHEKHGTEIRVVPFVDDLNALYASLDLLVLPSREHDPFGLVAAEAMMRGIPVIVTDQCGIAAHIDRGTEAIVCEAGSVSALREAIEELRDPARRAAVAQAGQQAAKERFTVERMVEAYDALLSR